ncbi:50S ribosomal protein L37ae [Candidatus Woesearchaeota archaeon]|nr:50S ribosomal protein L37ae [Candidatus Woesearchaeota archaeon]
MARKKALTKRLGPRYGTTVKSRLEKAEAEHKRKHKCPQCSSNSLKRVSAGIWQCTKCSSKFAGGAYSPRLKPQKQEKEAV